jgi:transcriptional regulator with XRE-family HTH domain
VRDAGQRQRPVGELLRGWRERRRLSQLDLSILAEISARRLSSVETGRSVPSRDVIVHLTEELDIPLRERNHLLLAAGLPARVSARAGLSGSRAGDTQQGQTRGS